MKLKNGDKAPEFTTMNERGENISLSSLRGRKVVLYFYPKDNTPTCTEESCNLRDHYSVLQRKGYEIFGISADSIRKHQNFIKKFNLPFSLLSDPDHSICEMYGVWGEKTLFGVNYMGIIRTTFVINEKGLIDNIIEKVESKRHADQILHA